MKIERVSGEYFERYGIVGRSRAIADLIQMIELVASTRSTVLITGETGTGKELVASAVHRRSEQRHMPFVKVNCAAIPETLLESELFGHVRGAFTGAAGTKRGKFALAHGGSILLDEIGTMGPTLQAKLLRVLQEREIEPLGSERPERVDVRVMAATNRDLGQLMAEKRFLEDLYYRLNVIQLVVAPLRERAEDIPMLMAYFLHKHATRNGRSIEHVDARRGVAAAGVSLAGQRAGARECDRTGRGLDERRDDCSRSHHPRSDSRHQRAAGRHPLAQAAPERRVDGTRDDSAGAGGVAGEETRRQPHGHQPPRTVTLPDETHQARSDRARGPMPSWPAPRRASRTEHDAPARYLASPICFMKAWLSHINHSSFMTPFSHRPIVTMSSLNGFLVGAIVLPPPTGIG